MRKMKNLNLLTVSLIVILLTIIFSLEVLRFIGNSEILPVLTVYKMFMLHGIIFGIVTPIILLFYGYRSTFMSSLFVGLMPLILYTLYLKIAGFTAVEHYLFLSLSIGLICCSGSIIKQKGKAGFIILLVGLIMWSAFFIPVFQKAFQVFMYNQVFE